MKFGIRECTNVVFRAKTAMKIGSSEFKQGQPVLYIDSAKTSTLEGASTSVYATGGRGNTRLITWEGEKTLTFTVEDALLSPLGFSILSGAGLIDTGTNKVHVHKIVTVYVSTDGIADVTDALEADEVICEEAPIFAMNVEADGSLQGGAPLTVSAVTNTEAAEASGNDPAVAKKNTFTIADVQNKNIAVDFYVLKEQAKAIEMQIDAENFAGTYYVEADTLFRRQDNGIDMPAIMTLPNVKIQSNFTFTMASSGDPSTFTFTMDAMPGYTYFDQTRKVLCVLQVIDVASKDSAFHTVMGHKDGEQSSIAESVQNNDSYYYAG